MQPLMQLEKTIQPMIIQGNMDIDNDDDDDDDDGDGDDGGDGEKRVV